MGRIETTSVRAKAMNGVHLFHYGGSQCSQRVRLALEEKGVSWTSQHLDLRKGEHLQPWYAEINPNLVVPTLVHDGQVVIESNDIIQYLDDTFAGPALRPEGADIERWLARSNACKPAIRVLSFAFLFGRFARKSSEQLARLQALDGPDGSLYKVHRDYVEDGLSDLQIRSAVRDFSTALGVMDRALQGQDWLEGEFSLADISWLCDVHRLAWMHFGLDRYPQVAQWYDRWRSRPSFDAAIVRWEPRVVRAALWSKAAANHALGRGPQSWRSP